MIKKLFNAIFGTTTSAVGRVETDSGVADLPGFVDYVARGLVDAPDAVKIEAVESDDGLMITVRCDKNDLGKVIGRNGKTIAAIRSLVQGAATRASLKVRVDVVES